MTGHAMTTAGLQAKVELRRAWFATHPDKPIPDAREEVEGLFAAIESEAVRHYEPSPGSDMSAGEWRRAYFALAELAQKQLDEALERARNAEQMCARLVEAAGGRVFVTNRQMIEDVPTLYMAEDLKAFGRVYSTRSTEAVAVTVAVVADDEARDRA